MIDFLYRKTRKNRKNNTSTISIIQSPSKTFLYIQKEVFFIVVVQAFTSLYLKISFKKHKLSRVFSLRRYLFLVKSHQTYFRPSHLHNQLGQYFAKSCRAFQDFYFVTQKVKKICKFKFLLVTIYFTVYDVIQALFDYLYSNK